MKRRFLFSRIIEPVANPRGHGRVCNRLIALFLSLSLIFPAPARALRPVEQQETAGLEDLAAALAGLEEDGGIEREMKQLRNRLESALRQLNRRMIKHNRASAGRAASRSSKTKRGAGWQALLNQEETLKSVGELLDLAELVGHRGDPAKRREMVTRAQASFRDFSEKLERKSSGLEERDRAELIRIRDDPPTEEAVALAVSLLKTGTNPDVQVASTTFQRWTIGQKSRGRLTAFREPTLKRLFQDLVAILLDPERQRASSYYGGSYRVLEVFAGYKEFHPYLAQIQPDLERFSYESSEGPATPDFRRERVGRLLEVFGSRNIHFQNSQAAAFDGKQQSPAAEAVSGSGSVTPGVLEAREKIIVLLQAKEIRSVSFLLGRKWVFYRAEALNKWRNDGGDIAGFLDGYIQSVAGGPDKKVRLVWESGGQCQVSPASAGLEEPGGKNAGRGGMHRRDFLKVATGTALPKASKEPQKEPDLSDEETGQIARLLSTYQSIVDAASLGSWLDGPRAAVDGGLVAFAEQRRSAHKILARLNPNHSFNQAIHSLEQQVGSRSSEVLKSTESWRQWDHSYRLAEAMQQVMFSKDGPGSMELWLEVRSAVAALQTAADRPDLSLPKEFKEAAKKGMTPEGYAEHAIEKYLLPKTQQDVRAAAENLERHGIPIPPGDSEKAVADYLAVFKNQILYKPFVDKTDSSRAHMRSWEDRLRQASWRPFREAIDGKMQKQFGRDFHFAVPPDLMAHSPEEAARIYEEAVKEASLRFRLERVTVESLQALPSHGAAVPSSVRNDRVKLEMRRIQELSLDKLREIDPEKYAAAVARRYSSPPSSFEEIHRRAAIPKLPAPRFRDTPLGRLAGLLAWAARAGAVDLRIYVSPDGSLRSVWWSGRRRHDPESAGSSGQLSREELKGLREQMRNPLLLLGGEMKEHVRSYHARVPERIPAFVVKDRLFRLRENWADLLRNNEGGRVEIDLGWPISLPGPSAGLEEGRQILFNLLDARPAPVSGEESDRPGEAPLARSL